MRAGESRTVIKRMQEFMDNLDRHVLNQKVLGNVKVKHLAAAFLAYKALQGMGKVENAETAGQIYAGGLQAIASMGGAFGMIGEKHFDGPENSDRTALNTMIVSATHFMVAQAENGEKLYDKDGRYTGTVVNRYDRDGKIIDSVPVYQVKEAAKSQMRKVAANFIFFSPPKKTIPLRRKSFMTAKTMPFFCVTANKRSFWIISIPIFATS